MVRRYGRLLAGWMKQSGFRDGCPITTTMLETAPGKEELTRLGREIFEQWAEIYVDALERAGVARGRAHELSTFATIAIEGSLILARVMQSGDPVLLAANEIARLFDREAKAA
jgi:TetR/AcrR family transcriptional repressor of lmrAB and yxaGH operons